jgi:hypothetical protein
VGLQRGPLNLVRSYLKEKNSDSGLENREYGSRADHATPFYPRTLALTLPTSGSHLVGTVRSRPDATEFGLV